MIQRGSKPELENVAEPFGTAREGADGELVWKLAQRLD
jgi:hypothetical protein